jgi:tRNA pseudouridine synthase 10
MTETAWRKTRLAHALTLPEVRAQARAALDAGPLCDHCLGRLLAEVDSGLGNDHRGRAVRESLENVARPPSGAPGALTAAQAGGAAPQAGTAASVAPTCHVCGGLFETLDAWAGRAQAALEGWEFDTLAVSSHTDPQITAREEALWQRAGGDLAEPYKQEFNRLLGVRLCDRLGCGADLVRPDLIVVADHAAGTVRLRVEPLFAHGRYRKLVRGMPQCRWRTWPTSIQQVIGDPICRAAGGRDHLFHGCGREDTDVRCLGERPFVVEVLRPVRRRLDWAALARQINCSGQVEVLGLERCTRDEVARLKELRPEKTYRALVRLAAEVDDARLARLASLVGPVRQRTPLRVLKRRPDLVRERRVVALEWRRLDGRTLELTVRAQAGTYIKELLSGNEGRTRPSVAEVLGVPAECAELDVIAIHAPVGR